MAGGSVAHAALAAAAIRILGQSLRGLRSSATSWSSGVSEATRQAPLILCLAPVLGMTILRLHYRMREGAVEEGAPKNVSSKWDSK